jgi:hypothetical protein
MRDLNDFREKTVRGEDLTFEEIQARSEFYNPYDYEDKQDFFSKEGLEDEINQNQKGVWIKDDEFPDIEKLKHTFGDSTVQFRLLYPTKYSDAVIQLWTESDILMEKSIKNVDNVKQLVTEMINHFYEKQDTSIENINDHFVSLIIKARKDIPTIDHQLETAKKTGYIQGVCECVAAIGDDHTLGKKLLSEMNVTKDMAKKFANPETYKVLEQGIFAPQQKLDQTHSRKL